MTTLGPYFGESAGASLIRQIGYASPKVQLDIPAEEDFTPLPADDEVPQGLLTVLLARPVPGTIIEVDFSAQLNTTGEGAESTIVLVPVLVFSPDPTNIPAFQTRVFDNGSVSAQVNDANFRVSVRGLISISSAVVHSVIQGSPYMAVQLFYTATDDGFAIGGQDAGLSLADGLGGVVLKVTELSGGMGQAAVSAAELLPVP